MVALNTLEVLGAIETTKKVGEAIRRLQALETLVVRPRTHIGSIAKPEFSGRELFVIRQSLGLSLRAVARMAGVSDHRVADIEGLAFFDGSRATELDIIRRVRDALHSYVMTRVRTVDRAATKRCGQPKRA